MEETTPTGVSETDQEAQFDKMYDEGAFEPEGQQQETPQEPEEAAPSWESFDDFIKANKADPEAIRSLPVTVKIDGQEKSVPLSEVIKSFQLEGHVNNKSIELSNLKTQFEAEQKAAREIMKSQLQQGQQLGQVAMQMLNQDFNRIDWNQLRTQNPAEYAALQAEFAQRQQGIQQYVQQIQQKQQDEINMQQAELKASAEKEMDKLLAVIPEWKDDAKFSQGRDSIVKYAKGLGFTDAELGSVYDHRILRALNDAAQFRALQASKPEAVKRVREAPKMGKPGSRTDTNPSDAKRQAAIERFNRNPRDIEAQLAAFEYLAS